MSIVIFAFILIFLVGVCAVDTANGDRLDMENLKYDTLERRMKQESISRQSNSDN